MKKQIKNSILGFAVLFGVFSCAPEDWIDYSINNDPDAPSTVPMSLILPAVQQSVAYQLNGNNTVRTTALWMQQFDGVARQSFTETRYQLTPADVNNVFDDIYSEILINCKIIIDQAEGSSPHFSGVAKVLTALSLGVATDLFGDIPYSEALQGSDNLTPAYDSQESIYQTIFSLLDSAISDLSQSDNVFPLAGDLMYDGDVSKWIKAAYSLKARHYIQLSNKSASAYIFFISLKFLSPNILRLFSLYLFLNLKIFSSSGPLPAIKISISLIDFLFKFFASFNKRFKFCTFPKLPA